MNYEKHYTLLIEKCQSRNWSKSSAPCYVEAHHIIPRCLDGTNDADNLVVMTAREHFIAHLLLAKIHGGKLWYAANMMLISNNEQSRTRTTSRMFQTIRENAHREVSQETRMKISRTLKGRTLSDETKQKMKGRTPWNKGNSDSMTDKQREAFDRTGIKLTDEHKHKVSESLKGKPKPIVQCPHCHKSGGSSAMKRWHFDNCKFKDHKS